jgi:hypothetical protein
MIPRGVPEIVSLFLTRLVQLFYDIPEPLVHDKLVSAFFRGTTFQPERFDEVRTSSALANWLERLSARTRSVSPVIRVEPSGDSTFRLGVEVEDRRDPMAPYISLAELFTASGPVFSSPPEWVRWEASRQLALAAEYLPRLREVLDSRGLQEPEVSSAEMAELLTRHATTLELLSIRLMLPRELAGLLRPRAAIRASLGSGARPPGFLDLADLLDFQWEISLGDYWLSVEEFRRLATAAEGGVRFKDGYVLLRPDEVKALLRKVSQPPPRPEPAEFLHWALSGERKGIPMRTDPRLREFLRGLSRAEKVDVPSSFRVGCAPTRKGVMPGCIPTPHGDWAAAWPTTWAWERRFKPWPCCSCSRKREGSGARLWWFAPPRCWETGKRRPSVSLPRSGCACTTARAASSTSKTGTW